MKQTATEINKLYKLKQKREKEEKKRVKDLDKRYAQKIVKFYEQIEKNKIRDKKKLENKIAMKYEKKEREVLKKPPLKKHENKPICITKLKKRVFANFQRCIRWDAKDEYGYVSPIDNPLDMRLWNDRIDAGHFYPKHNYPHLIFYKDNVHPQTKNGNRMQFDGVGTEKDELKKILGETRYNKLVKLAENKREKNLAIEEQSNRSFWLKQDEKRKKEKAKRLKE